MSTRPGIAFFDLDKTLLSVNSGSLWLRREFSLGHVSAAQFARAALWLARYHAGSASAESMIARAVAQLGGQAAAPLVQRTADFYTQEVREAFRPLARTCVEAHRSRGDAVVLLTSSSNYLSAHVARELRLDGVLCNTLEVDASGRHTGRVVGDICFGAGKVLHASREAKRRGVSLGACTFYSDSYSDVPVFELVGVPTVVSPDPRLRRHARRRGWPEVDWG